MKNKKKITVLGGLLLIVSVLFGQLNNETKENLGKVLSDVSLSLMTSHYKKLNIDDDFSKRVLKNYIDTLDYNHQYFTKDEVDDIYKKWGKKLDDNFVQGDSTAAFEIYKIYENAVRRVNEYQKKLLENPEKLDFTKDEKLLVDREDAEFFKTKKEYEDHWRKMLKASILSVEDYEELSYEDSVKRVKNKINTREKLLKKKTTDDIYSLFVNSFLAEYDPHTDYMSEKELEEFNISMKAQLTGIGAVLTTEKGFLKVVKILPDGPAAKGKELQPGDRIIAVAPDGENFEDIMDWPSSESINLIKGKKGTVVKLKVLPSGSKSAKIYTYTREVIKLESQSAKYFIKKVETKDDSYKIGVINLPAFYMDFDAYQKGDKNYKSTTRDIKEILVKLNREKVDGLIIDLRNNGGGSLEEVKTLMGLFIPYGPVVQIKQGGEVNYLGDTDMKVYFDKPVIVMVNRLSASASEIFAAAMQDYRRGLIIGTPTFGKGTVQTMKELDLGELKYTNAKFYRINGGSTQHKGVTPDILFPPTYDSKEVGESSLDNPLPWDEVAPLIAVEDDTTNQQLISYLIDRHIKRTKNNPDFIYEKARYALVKELADDDYISLNRETRKKEVKELEDKWLALTNAKLKAKGEKELKDYKALEEYNKERAKKDELDLLKEDGEIIETVRILADEIRLIKQ